MLFLNGRCGVYRRAPVKPKHTGSQAFTTHPEPHTHTPDHHHTHTMDSETLGLRSQYYLGMYDDVLKEAKEMKSSSSNNENVDRFTKVKKPTTETLKDVIFEISAKIDE